MKYIILYITSFLVFLFIDFIWLGFISRNLYKEQIGHLMAENVNFFAAFLFYALFVAAVIILAVLPAARDNDITKALLLALVFGLASYATYDLTNWATLKDWPVKIVIIDMIWGMFISSSTALASYYIASWLKIP